MGEKTCVYVAGLERGVRPIGDWSMRTTLSSCSAPVRVVRAWLLARAVDGLRQRAVENVVDQRAFAAAAHSRHHGHYAQRNANRHILQVVLARSGHLEPLARERARVGAMQHGYAPERYRPVSDSGQAMISAGVP
jgi:hypothetical protein